MSSEERTGGPGCRKPAGVLMTLNALVEKKGEREEGRRRKASEGGGGRLGKRGTSGPAAYGKEKKAPERK